MQERTLGGLKPATRRLLMQFGHDGAGGRKPVAAPPRTVNPGAVLVREWRGVHHQVTVLEQGAIFEGKRYRSLSEIARKITGSRWSGPLFFGLKRSQQTAMEQVKSRTRRCAIYTRKSSEEGLEQGFNSLQAQREACETFIRSQAGEGLAAHQDRLR
jgi:Protein of unknown function (DUF2924)